jgi:uncharacterized metal-binding protein YceD (DUF177 family)
MSTKREYEIGFVGLKEGIHEFEYILEDSFFKERGSTDENKIAATVKLVLDKNTGFMMLKFLTGGKAGVNCDRCGNLLEANLWDEFNMVVKLISNPEEMNEQEEDPDVFYISRTESHLDVSSWLYEFVILSIPTQNVCSEDENGKSLCNQEVIKKLEEMKAATKTETENSIWKGLEKFKNN